MRGPKKSLVMVRHQQHLLDDEPLPRSSDFWMGQERLRRFNLPFADVCIIMLQLPDHEGICEQVQVSAGGGFTHA